MTSDASADEFFATRSFLVSDAVRQGYGAGVFDHARWHRPFPGVRSRAPLAETLSGRAMQYLPRLRAGERFSHATALALLGCPVRVAARAPVDVSRPRASGHSACAGVTGHRHTRGDVYWCAVPDHEERIPVASPLDAVLQCATVLPFPELVVALDHLLLSDSRRYDRFLRVEPAELRRFARLATGRGVVRFREAAALARVGAESRMETLMRLAGVRVGGPEMRLQYEVRDRSGRGIGRFDAADEERGCLYEYDGEQHFASREQRRRDPRKHQAARDAGWRIMVFYSEDLLGSLRGAGRRMLGFCGREERPVRASLARLLDERSGDGTEPASPYRRDW